MTWGATAVAAVTIGGSYLSSQASKNAASTSADAQRYAADQAAEAAKFTPIGITNRFGSSNFGYDANGQLSSAGYTVSPELQAIQDRLMGTAAGYNYNVDTSQLSTSANQAFGAGTNLFNLGNQYTSISPEQAQQQYMTTTNALLAPGRERDRATTANQVFRTGRTGLATGGTTTGMLQSNPEFAALYNAQALQDLSITQQAQEQGRANQLFGANLYSTGANLNTAGSNMLSNIPSLRTAYLSPLQNYLSLTGAIEGMGQQPFALSSELAGRQSTAGANAGQFLYSGGANAARTNQMANQYSVPGAALTAFGTSPQSSSWFDRIINGNNATTYKGPSYGTNSNVPSNWYDTNSYD
jgi:hypothetical protein